MDKNLFTEHTQNLLRWSNKLDRFVVKKTTNIQLCQYCSQVVENQRIVCEPYRLGHAEQHFKHKCTNCKQCVFDGSRKREDQYQVRPINPHYTPVSKRSV